MTRTKPPFRADVVGSLLRTATLKEARTKREKGEITAAQLKEVEDREIEKIIKKQEEVGLKVATDGEFRRSWWHFDFYGMLDGVEIYELDHGIQFHGVQTKPRSIRIKDKLGFSSSHPMLEHFKFLKAHTRVTPKMCIPSPATMHFRLEPNAVTTKAYADRDAIFDDLAKTYKQAVHGFYDAGCRYLQFDDTAWAYLCSPAELKKAQGARPQCRSSGGGLCPRHQPGARGQAGRHGGHDPCVPRQFPLHLDFRGRLRADRRDHAGGTELRRLLPRIRQRARRRFRAAALFAEGQQDRRARPRHLEERRAGKQGRRQEAHRGGDQIRRARSARLSPQCGFASTEEGNMLADEEQWAKLRMVVELADEVWGK